MEGSASIGATQSAVMRSSRFRSSRATLSCATYSESTLRWCLARGHTRALLVEMLTHQFSDHSENTLKTFGRLQAAA